MTEIRKWHHDSYIVVGIRASGQRHFGRITGAHLEVFGIPPANGDLLYQAWFKLVALAEQEGMPELFSDQAEVLHAVVGITHDEIGYWDCYRWILLMAVIFDLDQIPKQAGAAT